MAHFNRFDILAAWNLYLQHTWAGQGCPKYKRHTRLRRIGFKPSRSEEFVHGLSENALEIYAALVAKDGLLERPEHPIANASEAYTCADTQHSLFRMWAGSATNSGLLGREVYVWADSFESAFEELVEWLDENAPGCLVSHEEARDALESYRRERIEIDGDTFNAVEVDDSELFEQVEQANDWTAIGHTSLKTGGHIRSDEWGGDEVEVDSDEYDTVLLAGTEAARAHWPEQDREAARAQCEEVFKTYDHDSASIQGIVRRNNLSTTQADAHPAVIASREYNARMRHFALVKLFCTGVWS